MLTLIGNQPQRTMSEAFRGIQLTYRLYSADFRALQNSSGYLRYIRGDVMLTMASLALLVLFILWNEAHQGVQAVIVSALIVLIIAALMNIYTTRSKLSENPMFRTEISCAIDEQSFHLTSEYFDYRLWWRHVYKVCESQNHFFIYESARVAHIVPKRAIAEEQLKTMRSVLINIAGLDVQQV